MKSRGRWTGGFPGLLLLALLAPGALPTRVEAATQVAAEAPKHAAHARGRRSGLEHRVALLSRALELDASQQAAVRKMLIDEREQMQRIWRDESLPSGSRIVFTKGVSRQTADRIRALLRPEQRKKYDPAPPDGPAEAVANAHVEDWTQGAARGAPPAPSPLRSEATAERTEGTRP